MVIDPREQRALTASDLETLDAIFKHRDLLGRRPDAKRLRIRQASMGYATGLLVYRLAKTNAPSRILEVGTCCGISAACLITGALASSPAVKFIGIEIDPEKQALADDTLSQFGTEAAWEVIQGNFDDVLEPVVAAYSPIAMAYIDGQHESNHTIRNWDWIVAGMPQGGILLVDDLSWKGMAPAQRYFSKHARVVQQARLAQIHVYEISPLQGQ